MLSAPAFLLSLLPCVATADWDFLQSGAGAESGTNVDVSASIKVAVLFAASSFGLLLTGIVQGGLLIPLLDRRLRLFQTLPLLNCGLYLLIRTCLISDSDPQLISQVGVGLPLAAFCGLLAAAFLAPFDALASAGRAQRSGGQRSETGQTSAGSRPAPPARLTAGESWWAAFHRGFSAPWEGFGFLCRYPRLWWFGVVPVVLNLIVTGAAVALFFVAAIGFSLYLHPLFPEGWFWGVIEFFCVAGLVMLAAGLGLVTYVFLQGSLIGYYLAKLAREVELQLGLAPARITEVSWRYEIVDACRDVVSLIVINGGFLLLHILPGIGSILGIAGSLYFDSLLFGEDYLDYPLALRGKRRQEKQEFLKGHRASVLGLGVAVLLVSFIPVVGAVLLASAVVGAVLLYRRLQPQAEYDEESRAGSAELQGSGNE